MAAAAISSSDVVVANLTAGAAAQNVRVREHRPQFVIARAARQRWASAEQKDQIGVVSVGGNGGPAGGRAPGQLIDAHGCCSLQQ
jgi:hypothetical protein